MKIGYELNEKEEKKFKEWWKEQEDLAVKTQIEKGDYPKDSPTVKIFFHDLGRPWGGCTSAGPIWELSETGIGTVVIVKHWYTKSEIDITDYDRW